MGDGYDPRDVRKGSSGPEAGRISWSTGSRSTDLADPRRVDLLSFLEGRYGGMFRQVDDKGSQYARAKHGTATARHRVVAELRSALHRPFQESASTRPVGRACPPSRPRTNAAVPMNRWERGSELGSVVLVRLPGAALADAVPAVDG